jgi:hypothetical protein
MRRVLPALALLVCSTAVTAAADLPVVDDCTEAVYLDRTAAGADREFIWDFSFPGIPERCIRIFVGQSVRWQGNFADHPLEADQGDRPNPIDAHAAGLVTFDRPGVFGYRCNFHLEMRGAIWVVAAPQEPSPVPAGSRGAGLAAAAALALLGFTYVRRLYVATSPFAAESPQKRCRTSASPPAISGTTAPTEAK